MQICKILQICKKVLTYGNKGCIIDKHELISVEAKCGYILTGGGNFRGVCFGLRPGGKFYFLKHLSQEKHAKLGLFIW